VVWCDFIHLMLFNPVVQRGARSGRRRPDPVSLHPGGTHQQADDFIKRR
jgi:hypothetical protein